MAVCPLLIIAVGGLPPLIIAVDTALISRLLAFCPLLNIAVGGLPPLQLLAVCPLLIIAVDTALVIRLSALWPLPIIDCCWRFAPC